MDEFEDHVVLLGAQRRRATEPVVVARPRNTQYSACPRDIDSKVGVVGEFTDQRER
jgi:hypothetical protein